jgi:hypothetical protein
MQPLLKRLAAIRAIQMQIAELTVRIRHMSD